MSVSVGFVILSHRGGDQMCRLVAALDREYDRPPIVIHHDFGQSQIDTEGFGHNVQFVRPHLKTSWANISVVNAALSAISLLYRETGPDWFFLLSGQDYPIMSGHNVRQALGNANVDAFIDIWPTEPGKTAAAELVGECNPGLSHFGLEGYRRMRWKLQFLQQFWVPILRLRPRLRIGRMTWRLPVKARHPFTNDFASYYGDLWFGANRRAAKTLVESSAKLEELQRYSRRRFLPEEGYFAIALANVPRLRLCRNNRRFVRWEGGNHPKLLNEDDLGELLSSGCFFARKFDADAPVLDRIDERLLSQRSTLSLIP